MLIGASISFLTFNIVTFILGLLLGKKCGQKQLRTKFVSAVEHSEQNTTGSRENAETLVPVYEEIVPEKSESIKVTGNIAYINVKLTTELLL